MPALSSKSPHLHVWHLTWEFPPMIDGGLGVACEGIYKGLLKSRACSVDIFHPSMMEGYGDAAGGYLNQDFDLADIDSLLGKIISGQSSRDDTLLGAVLRFSSWLLGRAVSGGQPEIVHAHDWHSILAAVALKKMYGVPMVLQMHSSQVERVGSFAKRGIRALEQWGIEQADAVISVSNVSAKSLISDYCVASGKHHVVRNAIDPTFAISRKPEKLKTLLFVGRFCSQKSPELAVEVFRKLVRKFPYLRLLMVGEGELLTPMRKLVDFYALQHKVELLGKVTPSDVVLIYNRADILMLPSIAEPFGMVALEAAQSGLAVILSDRCGAKEVLTSACVVEHRDADAWVRGITRLIESKRTYQELVKRLQKEAASRTWQDAAEEILAIYAKVKL